MRLPYLAQLSNVVGSVILLTVVLVRLPPLSYLQWILFTNIAVLFIQLETSISTVGSRAISRGYHAGAGQLQARTGELRRIYRVFGIMVFLIMITIGSLYLSTTAVGAMDHPWLFEWVVYSAGYLATFFPAVNYALLIGVGESRSYASILLSARVINVLLSVVLVLLNYAVLGLSVSFLVSASIGSLGYYFAAKRFLRAKVGQVPETAEIDPHTVRIQHILLHSLFIFSAFALYRFGLLLDAATMDNVKSQADFGLALQILTLISTLSAVPITMRVGPLVGAVLSRDASAVSREAAILSVAVNIVFLGGAISLAMIGPYALQFIGARGAGLPPLADLAMLIGAFWIEANIMVFVNILIATQGYRFSLAYAGACVVAWIIGGLAWASGASIYAAFVLIPALVQLSFTLPFMARAVRRATGMTMRIYAVAAIARIGRIIRHPVQAGLKFQD